MIERAVVAPLSRDWRIVWQEHAEATGLVSVCRRFRCTVFQRFESVSGGVVFEWLVFGSSETRFLMDSRAPSLVAAMADCEAFCRTAVGGETAENTGI